LDLDQHLRSAEYCPIAAGGTRLNMASTGRALRGLSMQDSGTGHVKWA